MNENREAKLNRAGSRRFVLLVVLCVAFFAACRKPATPPTAPVAPRVEKKPVLPKPILIVGKQFRYVVPGATDIRHISARTGEAASVLARENALKPNHRLRAGEGLYVDNRHLVPGQLANGLLINLAQDLLFVFKDGLVIAFYPVGAGRPGWQSPTGRTKVIEKKKNPTWHVPESIQEEMADKGKEVLTEVPPGPDNPLAGYWIGLGLSGIGVHGTNAPATVYDFKSHGCLRMNVNDAAALFPFTYVGQPVEIIYRPVLLRPLENGKIFLEVHKDIYNRTGNPLQEIKSLVDSEHVADKVDWKRITLITQLKEGLARDVTVGSRAPGQPAGS
jgi:L,D-transpeptidase ErfK/SrfK